MAAKAENKLIVIFEDEVRAAAALLHSFASLKEDATDEEYQAAALAAMQACHAALNGAHDEEAVLLLGRKPIVGVDSSGEVKP